MRVVLPEPARDRLLKWNVTFSGILQTGDYRWKLLWWECLLLGDWQGFRSVLLPPNQVLDVQQRTTDRASDLPPHLRMNSLGENEGQEREIGPESPTLKVLPSQIKLEVPPGNGSRGSPPAFSPSLLFFCIFTVIFILEIKAGGSRVQRLRIKLSSRRDGVQAPLYHSPAVR